MGLSHAFVAINNISPVQVTPTGDRETSLSLSIQNKGTQEVYIGADAAVSSISHGVALASGATVSFDRLPPEWEVWAISKEASTNLAVFMVAR